MVSDDEKKSVKFEQLYVSQSFISTTSSPAPASAIDKTQDVHDFQLKTALQSLGILLIELCFCQPIECGKNKVDLQPTDTSDRAQHQYCLSIAHAWTEEETYAHDPGFSDPVASCLNSPGVSRAKKGQSGNGGYVFVDYKTSIRYDDEQMAELVLILKGRWQIVGTLTHR